MASLPVNGIVVRYANYRDNDRILTLLTREQGLISASARGCRRPRSPLLGASELFVCGEYMLFARGDKYTVDACDVRESFYPIREDVARFAAGTAMLAVAERGGAPESGLFDLLYYALSFLSYAQVEPVDMAICFTVRALARLGMQPGLTRCARCGADLREKKELRFSPALGGAVCASCADAAPVSALSLEALRRMLLLEDEQMRLVRLPARVRAELKAAIRAYVSYALEFDFKSFEQM